MLNFTSWITAIAVVISSSATYFKNNTILYSISVCKHKINIHMGCRTNFALEEQRRPIELKEDKSELGKLCYVLY